MAAATTWFGALMAGTPPALLVQPAAELPEGSCAETTEKLPPAYVPA